MDKEHEFIRAVAREIGGTRQLPTPCHDELAAAALVLKVALDGRCPRCGRPAAVVERRAARCEHGHVFSVTRGTALHRTKISLPHWLTAIWHLHVDRHALSARTFALRYALRHATAWSLMHRVRRAFIVSTPRERGVEGPITHARQSPIVCVSRDGASLVVTEPGETPCPDVGAISREASAILGRARAWLTDVFCGVSTRYLHLYLAEFVARFGRPPAVAQG